MSEPGATVTLHAHGELTARLGRARGGIKVAIVPGATIRDLLAQLDVPTGEVWVCSRNGVLAKLDDPLADGDVVEAFSPVAGG
jgi:sulfur carrier protein ThiS